MKTNFLKSALMLSLISGMLMTSCVNDSDYDVPNFNCIETTLVKNKEVSDIPATPIVAQYTGDDVIEAYVTSSDEGGNFYKAISFQTLDGSRGFSVPVDVTSTFVDFQPGRKVLIKMKDLYTDSPTSFAIGMRIGDIYVSPTSGAASVGRLSETKYKNVLKKSCTVVSENDLVKTVTINQAKNDALLNVLIEIDNIQFNDDAVTQTYYNPSNQVGGATNHLLEDSSGNTVIFRTSSFSNYAGKPVATGSGKVRGIMTKYNSDYQFVARTENDIQLTQPRRISLLNETFSTNYSNWVKFSVTGAQTWTLDTQFGNPGSCAKMSGYSSGNQANEDWLISPAQDFSTLSAATLAFDNAYKFDGPIIEVYLSNNYSGSGTPYAAGVTWTQINGATLSAGNYAWTNSGGLNIDSFTGVGNATVYIAFKYLSTTAGASTWEIDNVRVTN